MTDPSRERHWEDADVLPEQRHVLRPKHPRDRTTARETTPAAWQKPDCVPLHRTILGVDIVNSTARLNTAKAHLRRHMHRVLDEALRASGITERHRDPLVDRGDGALIIIKPSDEVPKTILLAELVPALGLLLAQHNDRHPQQAFRLRVAIHAGEVHYDQWGQFGEALDVTCRLLDAPALKSSLASSTAPLALAISDDIYRSIVRHGYENIDDKPFNSIIHVEVAGFSHAGWIRDENADTEADAGHVPTIEELGAVVR